ncbi:hypothetical protein FDUTEX481_08025 [Tolypothrix sp. PCC 7601]|nr:hypothetical protein FDUTEX481_08025 [Tolypothrix sp. PCC 7601]
MIFILSASLSFQNSTFSIWLLNVIIYFWAMSAARLWFQKRQTFAYSDTFGNG